jgi:uncharacterized protein (TIGR02266 family)
MDQPPPKESRAPINLRIKFRSESIDQFIDRYSIDVSRGGIFIRTREPLAVGTQLKFDFQLQDSSPLMAGEGTVVWIREYDANRTGITPGMGVRFDKLTAASQPVLEKILAEKGRRDQGNASGGVMSKVGAGMAVRRPSSTFTALDPRALGLVAGAGPAGETPAAGNSASDAATRRERRPSSPTLQSGTAAPSPPVSERTHQGGFGVAGGGPGPTSPGNPTPRARTPGALPALESTGSGRHTGGASDVSSLVSRLAAARQANFEAPTSADIDKALDGLMGDSPKGDERTPIRSSPLAGADDGGVPGLREDDAASEPTKTGNALSDLFTSAGKLDTPDRIAAAAAAAGTVDGAAPTAEIDSDRTLATSAEQVAQIVADAERVTDPMDKTARDLPAIGPTVGSPAPSLVLIKNQVADNKVEKAQGLVDRIAPPSEPRVDAKIRRDELIASEKTPQPTLIASSTQAPAVAGSFTTGRIGAASASAETPAAGPAKTSPPEAAPLAAPAKSGSARPVKRRSAVPFVIGGLVLAAAIVAVVTARQGGIDHSQESFQPKKAEETVAGKTPLQPTPSAAVPAPPASAEPAAAAATAPSTPATEPPKPAEATPAANAAGPAPSPAAEATPPPPAGPAPAKAPAARTAQPATERKTTVTVGPKRSVVASGVDGAGTGKKGDAAEAAGGGRPVVQHVLKITSTPTGAEVLIDGQSVGTTPYQAKEIDAEAPHAVTIRLDGYEPHEHMISASDWLKLKANLETAKVSVKLRKVTAAAGEPGAPKADGTVAEPANTESSKTESSARNETKSDPSVPIERPVEKVEKAEKPEKAEKASEPTAPPGATEPPKAADEPAAPPK